jgi:aminoglycoside/choline kinase family phosphotransferase
MSFVEGRFFEGGAASVECVGRSIGRLHRKLQAAPIAPAFRRRYVHLSDDDAQLFDEVLAAQCPMLQPFGDTNALLLAEHRDLLRRAWNTVLARQEAIHRAQCGLMHMDLHPHNILMQGDQVAAFLDFNSLKTGPLNMMLGFGAYKLLRQSVQHTDPGMSVDECQKLTDKFLDSYFKEFPEHAASRECIGHFALAEVCRRIGVIFRLTLRQANTSWNHVLKIHLAGIREICILFGLECKP